MPGFQAHSRRSAILAVGFAIAIVAAGAAFLIRLSGNDGVVLIGEQRYTEGVAGTWQRVNPLYASANEVDSDLSHLVFAGLLRIAPDGRVIPDMADMPTVSDDDRTYTFKIRRNVRWHDGAPVTSRDVAFTVRMLVDAEFRGDPILAEGWRGAIVETPDDETVIVTLRQASSPFLARSATIGILPEHLLGTVSAADLYDATFNASPVGSGPYRVVALDSREARLTAYDNYHLGRPNFDSFTLRFYTDDAAASRALQSGDVGALFLRRTPSPGELADLSSAKDIKVEQIRGSAHVLLYLNTSNAMFVEEEVRRAISLGIDRQAIANLAYAGTATPSSSPIAPGSWSYVEEYDQVELNRSEARTLLQDAGWQPAPSTGILTREGQEFRFTIRVDNDPARLAAAGEIASQLEGLGIRVSVASTTFSVLRRDYLEPRRFEAAISVWDQGPDPDPYFAWHSSQLGSAGLNFANYENTIADELIAQGRMTNDLDIRRDSYRQFQEIWQTQSPSVVLVYPRLAYAHPDGLDGLTTGLAFFGASRFADIQKWSP